MDPELSTPVAAPASVTGIPGQRPPSDPFAGFSDDVAPYQPAVRRSRLRSLVADFWPMVVGALGLFVVLAIVVALLPSGPPETPPAFAGVPAAALPPPTPTELINATLYGQAAALLRGDENGWLGAVDVKLRPQYRNLFRSLRGLGVSEFEYRTTVETPDPNGVAIVDVDVYFCFSVSVEVCHPDNSPMIRQVVTMALVGGHYTVTKLAKPKNPSDYQPTPWESGALTFAQGKRVTVAAPASEVSHLQQVVALADKAAAVTDRFAGIVGNPVARYRIYLADNTAWRSWYGGIDDKTSIGLQVPLGASGGDVILKMSELRDPAELQRTLQHEMGHVATVGGDITDYTGISDSEWLTEGLAEYIEWSPKPASASLRRYSVRWALHRAHPPTTIDAKPLTGREDLRTVDAYYGLGHFAVDCMAQKYGQAKMLEFARQRLRESLELDRASRLAFGLPFASVDKGCVSWIRNQV